MEAVFLGMNDAGEEVYDWLNQREDVEVLALLTEKEQLSLIKELEPEIVISAGFEHKVPKEIIEVPEQGIVNLHPSYLPYNRGSHAFIWPIADRNVAGVSIHYMTENIDEGPIIDKRKIDIEPDDTAGNLHDKLMSEQVDQFKEFWPRIKEGIRTEEQDPEEGTVNYKKDLDDYTEIELKNKVKAGDLIDKLRALTYKDQKLAYFKKNGDKYYIEVDIVPESEISSEDDSISTSF
jgi:methionyl-tRNA formyltransferase